jgi:DNA-binding FadR family transcriptional regulator
VAALKARVARKADVVSQHLLGRIVSGELPVGSLLPREDELAKEYEVNRSVVREAIKLLEVHRLVRPIKKRGTEVLSPLASLSPEVLRAMLRPRPGVIDRHVLQGLLEIRASLDVQMSGLAAERRTRADLQAMEAALADMRAALGDMRAYLAAADELSLVFARATHNPLFEMLAFWNRMVVSDLEHLFLSVRAPSDPHVLALAMLVDRIRARDAQGARRLVQTFHDWAVPRLLEEASREGNFTKLMERLK